jgi:hypothetical protein
MAEASGGLIESIVQLPGRFAEIAAQSPEQAILILIGALLTAAASVVFGVLSVGGLAAAATRVLPTGTPPEEARRGEEGR